jgi:DNA-binding response OmpR family regulator
MVQTALLDGPTGIRRGPRRILVADDEPAILRLVHVILERHGYEVIGVDTRQHAMHIIQCEQPDFLILDASKPEPDGYAVMRQTRADPTTAHLPVLMLWAMSAEVEGDPEHEAGADYYLQKPINPAELVRIVSGA